MWFRLLSFVQQNWVGFLISFFLLILIFLVRVGPKYRLFKDYIARTWVGKKLKGNQYSNPNILIICLFILLLLINENSLLTRIFTYSFIRQILVIISIKIGFFPFCYGENPYENIGSFN